MTATLLDFDSVNDRLHALVERQADPSGCQVVFVPNESGACYTAQIAFRGRADRQREVRQFLRECGRILRAGGRQLCLRTYWSRSEVDSEHAEAVSTGAMRVWAAETQGGLQRIERHDEPVNLGVLKGVA